MHQVSLSNPDSSLNCESVWFAVLQNSSKLPHKHFKLITKAQIFSSILSNRLLSSRFQFNHGNDTIIYQVAKHPGDSSETRPFHPTTQLSGSVPLPSSLPLCHKYLLFSLPESIFTCSRNRAWISCEAASCLSQLRDT